MIYIFVALVVLAIVLFTVSFLKENKVQQVEDQIEGTSVTLMQELYKLKKKVKVLEEELMIEDREQ